jgi:hypothetical protein
MGEYSSDRRVDTPGFTHCRQPVRNLESALAEATDPHDAGQS